jgi:hypothetical protein
MYIFWESAKKVPRDQTRCFHFTQRHDQVKRSEVSFTRASPYFGKFREGNSGAGVACLSCPGPMSWRAERQVSNSVFTSTPPSTYQHPSITLRFGIVSPSSGYQTSPHSSLASPLLPPQSHPKTRTLSIARVLKPAKPQPWRRMPPLCLFSQARTTSRELGTSLPSVSRRS